jgi:acetyl esterase
LNAGAKSVVLEPGASQLTWLARGAYPNGGDVHAARAAFEELQLTDGAPVDGVEVEDVVLPCGPSGATLLRLFRPGARRGPLPVILYAHGPGWVLGGASTHDRLMRELARDAGAAVAFVEYRRAPEARYPQPLEECYSVLAWLADRREWRGLDVSRIALAGDSAGANLAIGTTLLAKERDGPRIRAQVLFCPVTDAGCATDSQTRFADGFCLSGKAMRWFWDQYLSDPADRDQPTVSPLRAAPGELSGLPPALVITAEADVLRDEGEAYAAKLRADGVGVTAVRYQGALCDFVVLNALRSTSAAEGAIRQAGAFLSAALAEVIPVPPGPP